MCCTVQYRASHGTYHMNESAHVRLDCTESYSTVVCEPIQVWHRVNSCIRWFVAQSRDTFSNGSFSLRYAMCCAALRCTLWLIAIGEVKQHNSVEPQFLCAKSLWLRQSVRSLMQLSWVEVPRLRSEWLRLRPLHRESAPFVSEIVSRISFARVHREIRSADCSTRMYCTVLYWLLYAAAATATASLLHITLVAPHARRVQPLKQPHLRAVDFEERIARALHICWIFVQKKLW